MKHFKLRIFLIAVASILALAIITFAIGFSACRWWLANDASDIQGPWTIEDSDTTITISDTEIRMSSDVIFTYTLDSGAKSLTENLAGKTGKVHYIFSADKTELILIEEEMDFFSSAFLDAGNLLQTFFSGNYSDSSAGFVTSGIADSSIVRLHKGLSPTS